MPPSIFLPTNIEPLGTEESQPAGIAKAAHISGYEAIFRVQDGVLQVRGWGADWSDVGVVGGSGGEGGFTEAQIRAFFAAYFAEQFTPEQVVLLRALAARDFAAEFDTPAARDAAIAAAIAAINTPESGLTEAQVQALIATATATFISQTQIQALIDAAITDASALTRAFASEALQRANAIAYVDPALLIEAGSTDLTVRLIPPGEDRLSSIGTLINVGGGGSLLTAHSATYLELNRQLAADEVLTFVNSYTGEQAYLTAANFEVKGGGISYLRATITLGEGRLKLQQTASGKALKLGSQVEVGRNNLSAALKSELDAAGGTIDPAVFAAMAAAYFATRFSDEQVEALKAIAAEDFAGDITAINARIDGLDLGLDESQVSALIAAANANFLTATAISALIAAAGGGGVDRGVIVAASSVGEASEFANENIIIISRSVLDTIPPYQSGRIVFAPVNEGDSDIAEEIVVRGIDWESNRYWAIRGGAKFTDDVENPVIFSFSIAEYTMGETNGNIVFGVPFVDSTISINIGTDLYFAFLVDRTTGNGEYFINGVKIGESLQVNPSLVGDDFIIGNFFTGQDDDTFDGELWDIEVVGGDAAFDGAALSTAGRKFDGDERRVALIGRENAYLAQYAVDQTARNAAAAALTAAQNAGGSGEDETARATATNALTIARENRAELERVVIDKINDLYADADGSGLVLSLDNASGAVVENAIIPVGTATGTTSGGSYGNSRLIVSRALTAGEVVVATKDGEVLRRFVPSDFSFDDADFAGARGERGIARRTLYITGIVSYQLQTTRQQHLYELAEFVKIHIASLPQEALELISRTAAISLPAAMVAAAEVFTANSSTATESTPYGGLILIRAGAASSNQNDYAVGDPANLFHGIMGIVCFALPNSAHLDPRFVRYLPPGDSQNTDVEVADANTALNGFVVYTMNLTRSFGTGGQLFGGTIRIDSLVASELFKVPAESIIESKDRAFLTRAQIAAFVEWGFVSKPDALLLHQFFQNARVVDVAVFNFSGEINPLFAGFAADDNIPTTAAGRTAMNLALATDQAKTFGVSNRFPTLVVDSDDTGNWIDIDRFPAGGYAARMVVVDATFQSGFVGEGVLLLINSKAADKALCFIYQPDQDGGRIVARYPNADGDAIETTIAENMAGTKKRLSFYFTTSAVDVGNLEFLVSINGLGAGGRLVANIATADINFASLEVGFDGKTNKIIVPDPNAADPLVPVNPSLRRPPTQSDLGNRQVLVHSAFTNDGRGQKESANGLGRLDNSNGDFLLGIVDSAPTNNRTRAWLLGERLGGDITQQIQGRLPDNRIFRTIYGHICTGWYVQHYGDDAHKGVYVVLEGDAIASGAYRQDDDGNWLPRFGGGNITIYITGFELTSRQYRGEYVLSDNIKDVWVEENGGNPYTFIRGGIDNSIFAYDRELVAEGTNKSAFEWAFDRGDPVEASDRLVGDLDVITADDARLYSTRAAVWIHEYALATLAADSNIAAKFSGISVRVWVTPAGGRVLELADGTFGEAEGARAVIDANGVRIYSADNKFKGGTIEEIVMFERLDAVSGDTINEGANSIEFESISDNGGLDGFRDPAILFLLVDLAFGNNPATVSSRAFWVVRPVNITDSERVYLEDNVQSSYIGISSREIAGSHPDHRIRRVVAYVFSAAA